MLPSFLRIVDPIFAMVLRSTVVAVLAAVPLIHGAQAQSSLMGDLNADGILQEDEIDQWEIDRNFETWLQILESVLDIDTDPGAQDECMHTGVRWVPARIVSVGELQCDGTPFLLELGGTTHPSLRVNWIGCPMHCDIELGHYARQVRLGKRVIHRFDFPWQRQNYAANCQVPACVPVGVPTPLAPSVSHWVERFCNDPDSGLGNGDEGGGSDGSSGGSGSGGMGGDE
ncbi:MAG: hypothetical protein AAGG01_05550 [Planctomycetota bacterium]